MRSHAGMQVMSCGETTKMPKHPLWRACLAAALAVAVCAVFSFTSFSASVTSLTATREITASPVWRTGPISQNPPSLNLLPPQSRLAYANACRADIGTIPDYHCLGGTIIPITKNNVPQTVPLTDNSCDNPVKLGLPENQCMPYTRLVDLSPANNPDVTVLAICRKYHASSGPNDPIFHDLAMIAHSRKTGATCFFQSPVDSHLDGTNVPSPMSSASIANQYWLGHRQLGYRPACEMRLSRVGGRDDDTRLPELCRLPLPG